MLFFLKKVSVRISLFLISLLIAVAPAIAEQQEQGQGNTQPSDPGAFNPDALFLAIGIPGLIVWHVFIKPWVEKYSDPK
ncbi:MAG: hypothetical protein F6K41_23155 [Symploca sp. SIO3E6]|nr:hypothetical protein [Caldora sp. SIO3E6]